MTVNSDTQDKSAEGRPPENLQTLLAPRRRPAASDPIYNQPWREKVRVRAPSARNRPAPQRQTSPFPAAAEEEPRARVAPLARLITAGALLAIAAGASLILAAHRQDTRPAADGGQAYAHQLEDAGYDAEEASYAAGMPGPGYSPPVSGSK